MTCDNTFGFIGLVGKYMVQGGNEMTAKRYLLIVMSVLLVVGLVLSLACAKPAPAPAPAPAPKPEPIKLTSISFLPPTNARSIVYQDFLKAITEKAKGELVIEYKGGPEVIPYTEQPTAIRKGVIDMSFMGASALKGLVPEALLMTLSRLSPEDERTSGATALMRKHYAKSGLFFVGRLDPKLEPRNFSIYLNEKVATPEDFNGLRMGAAGTYCEAMAKALGISFTIIKTEDAYSALDRGMIDAYCYSLDGALSYSLQEVVPYSLEHAFYRSNTNITMNLDRWNSLSGNLQKLVEDTYVEYEPKFIDASAKGIIDAKKKFLEAGVEFISFSAADAEQFMDIAYGAEAELKIKDMPDTAPEYLKLVKAIK